MNRPVVWGLFIVAGLLAAARADEPYGRFQFDESELEHWAFQPVRRIEPPAVNDAAWVQNPIDAFVLAELEKIRLRPAALADRRTLLRRAYFDLIGLPPTPDEQERFLSDTSPRAFARLVDELLARPEYGERWGRYWLDVVRYAESNGYERDGAKPNVWRYRDWVIQAFNDDLPYDEFVRQQLAGDELDGSNAAMQIATTFLRLGPWDDEPADPMIDRYDQLDDIVGATSAVFLAQTVKCARCHDHKFEPFSQRDYSRLVAVFEPLRRPQDGRTDLDRVVGTAEEVGAYQAAVKTRDERVAQLRGEQEQCEFEIGRRLAAAGQLTAAPVGGGDAAESLPEQALAAFQIPPVERNEQQRKLIGEHRSKLRSMLRQHADEPEKEKLDQLKRQIEQAQADSPPQLAKAYIWFEEGQQAPVTHVFRRGDPRTPQEEVSSGVPAILTDAALPPATPTAGSTGRRRQLADWLTQPQNPLTARVMANRIWQHHFGDGLVSSENDFGVMGDSPSHPELLDWLASEFVAGGWNIKHLHRLMMLSSTYQTSSVGAADSREKDPNGRLLSRFMPRRLEAEAIRDAVLSVSGTLNHERGGPSVFPEVSAAVLASQSRPGNGWTKSDPRQAARRSVYVFVKRTLPLPEFEVLDFPDTNGPCEQRQVSTVAPQALTLLNGAFMHEQSRHFARRLLRESTDPAGRVELAYRLALSRGATDSERTEVLAFLAKQEEQIRAEGGASPSADAAEQALAAFCLVLLNTNEFVYLR